MMKTRIRTVGLSLLGGGREALPEGEVPFQGMEGKFELGIRSIEAINRDPEKGEPDHGSHA